MYTHNNTIIHSSCRRRLSKCLWLLYANIQHPSYMQIFLKVCITFFF